MAMPTRARKWTIAEMYRLPEDGNKYELVRGELFVTPPTTDEHETIAARLTRLLDPYVAEHRLGYVYRPRAVIRLDESTEVEPDLMVRQPEDRPNATWKGAPLPILVVEILSDSTRRRDHLEKRTAYIGAGIPEYWIVDGDERTIRVVRPGVEDEIVPETVTWQPRRVASPLVIDLADVFGSR